MGENLTSSKLKKAGTVRCPSCGKNVPKGEACRECGARFGPKGRLSLKRINLLLFFFGILGVALMCYAYYEATYILPNDQITPDMEGKTVRISGLVIDVYYDPSYEKTSFTVMDKTGTMSFFGWSDFTSDVREAPSYPSIGDNITVEGIVNVYNNKTSIEVSNAESYEIIWISSTEVDIGDLLLNDLYRKVTIEGNVTDKYTSYSGSSVEYVTLTVSDATGYIKVFISGDQVALAGKYAILPNLTQTVRITGMVDEFNGELEIIPSNATSGAINVIGVDLKERGYTFPEKQYIPGYDLPILLGILSFGIILTIYKKRHKGNLKMTSSNTINKKVQVLEVI